MLVINLSLHIFYFIIYHSSITTNSMVHVSYYHILTSLLDTLGFGAIYYNIKLLSDFDKIIKTIIF